MAPNTIATARKDCCTAEQTKQNDSKANIALIITMDEIDSRQCDSVESSNLVDGSANVV